MDPFVEAEKLDPAVPFRAVADHIHHTWALTFHSHPELLIRPRNTEEIRKIVNLARRCRRRIVVVGCGHSPSDLTCTSSWAVNLDHFNRMLSVDKNTNTAVLESGIHLHEIGKELANVGLGMPNLGSIDHQSIAGAIGTGTHGSSLRHGLISQSVVGLKIMLADGTEVSCSKGQNEDLFRAALLSLGVLGIITEVTFQAVPHFNIEWNQSLQPLDKILSDWETNLWTESEYVRVWWLPYLKKAVLWKADKTTAPMRPPKFNWYGGNVGFHTYHILLYISTWIPSLLPTVEWFVFGMQYGFKDNTGTSAVEDGHSGLMMDCLFSQFVDEWAIPLSKGPEAISRISTWLHGDQDQTSGIPFDPRGLYVHSPIEVRVSDPSRFAASSPQPYLDISVPDGPTLYLNFTLYRPFHTDPPGLARYYEAVEWLMKSLGGRPHWAKNFATVSKRDIHAMYPDTLPAFLAVRDAVDPDGMFVGAWHRRTILPDLDALPPLPLEEREKRRFAAGARAGGGVNWLGESAVGDVAAAPVADPDAFDRHREQAARAEAHIRDVGREEKFSTAQGLFA
ncbi:MAG: hypothetical protein M1819_000532 [Sarea resinae]|nr:MAG: hypothetical protein M1819_000532 [Sarea resinae]